MRRSRSRSGCWRRTSTHEPLRPVAAAGARGHPGLRRRGARADALRRGAQDRPEPRGGAAVPAHARRARLRPHRRTPVQPQPPCARARLRLPVEPQPARGGRAPPRGARGRGARVVVDVGAGRWRHRLRRPRAGLPHHDRRHQRRHPLPGVRHLDGPGHARRPLRRGAGRLPGDGRAQAPVAAHGHLHRRAARGAPAGTGPGMGDRRPGARGGAARGGGAGPGRQREGGGGDQRPAPPRRVVDRVHAPRPPAAAARDGGPDRGRRARGDDNREALGMNRPVVRMSLAVVLLALNLRTIFASLPPLLADVRADLGLSAGAAGLLTTLPVVCLGALAPLAPRLARRTPIERLLVACALLTAAGTALRGAGGVAALFAGTLVAGAAVAVAQALVPVLIRDRFPEATGTLTGAFSMALTLGAALAAGLAVPLERLLGDEWTASLAIWAVPALVAAAVWAPRAARPGTIVGGGPGPALLRVPLAWSVAVFFGVQSMAFYAGLAWLPSILRDSGYDAADAGGLQALAQAVQLLPAFAVPVLAARSRGQAPLLIAIVALAGGGLVGLLAAPAAAGLWMVLVGLGQGGALGLALILPVLRGGDVKTVASLTAMALCAGYLIAATGPWLLGAVRDATGDWTVPLVLLIAITAAELLPGAGAVRDRSVSPVPA